MAKRLEIIPSEESSDRKFINETFDMFFSEKYIKKQIRNGCTKEQLLPQFRQTERYDTMRGKVFFKRKHKSFVLFVHMPEAIIITRNFYLPQTYMTYGYDEMQQEMLKLVCMPLKLYSGTNSTTGCRNTKNQRIPNLNTLKFVIHISINWT